MRGFDHRSPLNITKKSEFQEVEFIEASVTISGRLSEGAIRSP